MRILITSLLLLISSCSTHDYSGKVVLLTNTEWSPTNEQVSEVFDRLQAAASREARKRRVRLEDWEEYNFQYTGVIHEDNSKLIYINAFCSYSDDWKVYEVIVFDGGACYFQAYYDPVKRIFTNLGFNGVS